MAWAPAVWGGVVVETLGPDSALAQAGVEAGDVLETWSAVDGRDAREALAHPCAFEALRLEQGPRGPVKIFGRRGSRPVSFAVPPGNWTAVIRPDLNLSSLESYRQLVREVERGEAGSAFSMAEAVVASLPEEVAWEIELWWWLRLGELLQEAGALEQAENALIRGEEIAGETFGKVLLHLARGRLAERALELDEASKHYRAVLEPSFGEVSMPLVRALAHSHLGKVALARGEMAQLHEHTLRALALTEEVAPQSFALARCLNAAAHVATFMGAIDVAESSLIRARELLIELAPQSNELGTTLLLLGAVERHRNRLGSSEAFVRRSLEIAERLAPEERDAVVAYRQRAMAELARMKGDLATAEDFARRALDAAETETPGSWQLAMTLTTLGDILGDSGREQLAEGLYRRALVVLEGLGNGFFGAHVRGNLAAALADLGRLEEAEEHTRRTLTFYREVTPRGLSIPWALRQLGELAQARGDLAASEGHLREAVAFLENHAPHHLLLATCLVRLGDLLRLQDRLPEAEAVLRRSFGIYERGGGLIEEIARHRLGLALAQKGDSEAAAEELSRAVLVLENQFLRMGGSRMAQGGLRARARQLYDDALAAQLTVGDHEQAFQLLERSRARSLLDMLAERDLDFALELPEALRQAQLDLEQRYRRAVDAAMVSGKPEELRERLAALALLREEQSSLVASLRRTAPRYAALRYPQPLEVEAVRRRLDPGTVLVAFHVASSRTDLFVVTAEKGLVETATLPVGSAVLEEKVEEFRTLIRQRRHPGSPLFRSLTTAGRDLYDLLIAPVADSIEGGERLLIVPDGALHRLPFAALVRPAGDYLIAWRPLQSVLSATLYAQLTERPRPTGAAASRVRLAAFGDPRYPSWAARRSETVAESRARGSEAFRWTELPFSRFEVEAIAGLFPAASVRLYLGDEATEEAVLDLPAGLDLVHFAVHGQVDDHFPLNSALALTIPEDLEEASQNGLLQAWEIFDRLRLDVDLVVLSACATALGQERGGEGLVGLARAFHYAGARAVLASLWNIDDRATAELMVHFYRGLREGRSKDEALRAAQLALIGGASPSDSPGVRRGHEVAAPYYWSAFQIYGAR
ncbi:MAG: CHAT domain-containing protein [Acidobacteriota bacterium]